MKKNNPAFKDEVDEILTDFGGKTSYELSKPTKDVRMKPLVAEARKALDQAYQKEFLAKIYDAEIWGQINGVKWAIKEIDYWHGVSGGGNVADKLYKGLKNKMRESYQLETGLPDPAPRYPITTELKGVDTCFYCGAKGDEKHEGAHE